jgi:pimeloyl-ACP methyl ester carboxylesterase
MSRNPVFALLAILVATICVAQSANSPISTGSYLEVTGGRIWYQQCGDPNSSPGVVLLHDGLVNSITWDGVWAPLCAKYHVVRYDRRGYGRSDPAKTAFAPTDDLYAVMRQVHMDRTIVVGNSSGGALALDFALAHPEMVTGLFLIGPVVHGMGTSDYFIERGSKNNAPLDKDDARAAAKNWSTDRFLIAGDDPKARQQLYDDLVQNPQNLKVSGVLEQRPSPPTVTRLSQIRVPILLVVGEADIADVFANCGAVEAAAPLASFEVWKNNGHLIQLQSPADLVKRFDRFYQLATRKEAVLDPQALAVYAGEYTCFNRPSSIFLRDDRLIFELPGDHDYWLFAAADGKFFLRTEEAAIEFHKDGAGKITEMVINNSDGSVFKCPRVSGASH